MSFLIRHLYIRLSPERLRIDSPGILPGFDDVPVLAIQTQGEAQTIVAIGRVARDLKGADLEVIKPFESQPASDIEFQAASRLLQYGVHKLLSTLPWHKKVALIVRVIMHPTEVRNEELEASERKSLVRLAESVGGRRVCIHVGRELVSSEIESYGLGI